MDFSMILYFGNVFDSVNKSYLRCNSLWLEGTLCEARDVTTIGTYFIWYIFSNSFGPSQ